MMNMSDGWSRDPKNLSKGQIQNAIRNTNSLVKASADLHVCYDTFRKYAVRHGISITEHSNQQGRGIMKPKRVSVKKKMDWSYGYKDGFQERWEGTMGSPYTTKDTSK